MELVVSNLIGATIAFLVTFFVSRYFYRKAARLNRQVAWSITGGDSFPSVVAFVTAQNEIRDYFIVHNGDHTLYDIGVRFLDLDEFERLVASPPLRLEDMHRCEVLVDVGNLGPSASKMMGLGQQLRRLGDRIRWQVFMNARNGFFSEELRLAKLNGEWRTAMRVARRNMTTGDLEIVLERVDDDYPRDQNGQVDW